jgi:hypothetical protein
MPTLDVQLTGHFGDARSDDADAPTPGNAGGTMTTSMSATLPGETAAGTPGPPIVDTSALGRLVSRFTGLDMSGIDRATASVGSGSASISLPGVDSLLAPLQPMLRTASSVDNGSAMAVLEQLRGGPAEGPRVGMAGLEASLGHLLGVRQGSALSGLIGTATSLIPVPVDVDGTIGRFRDVALSLRDLVNLIGGMMAMHAAAEDVRDHAALIDGLLLPDTAKALLARAKLWADAPAVVAALEAVQDPDDDAQVEAAERPVRELVDALRAYIEVVVRGMAFGEATLIHADPAVAVQALSDAAALLRTVDASRVRASAVQIAGGIERFVPELPGSLASDFDTLWDQVTALTTQIITAIEGLSAEPITRPVSNAIGTVTNVVHVVNEGFAAVSGAIRGAFALARQAVEALDLQGVVSAIQSFLQPLVDAIAQLDALLGTVMGAIGTFADELGKAIKAVTKVLGQGASAIRAGLQAVKTAFDSLNLQALVDGLRDGIQSIVDELHKVQLQPYFDTAIDVMNTSADVIEVVPLELLPDSAKQKLHVVIGPIRAIDFQVDVADVLKGVLDEILDRLDTDVLDEVSEAFGSVITFLESIDPHPMVADLDEQFDAFAARVQAIDPEELLRPAIEAIDKIKQEIAAIDIRTRVLGPVTEVFDRLLAGFDQLNPAPLLQPIEDQVGQLRQRIIDVTKIDQWTAKVDEIYQVIDRFLGRLNLVGLGGRLDAVVDGALASVGGGRSDTSLLGSLIAGLIETTGLRVRPRSFLAASRWITGEDGAVEVRAMVAAGATSLAHARDTVTAVDIQTAAAQLDTGFRRVKAAVEAHAAGSKLRLRFDPMLAAVAPLDQLGALSQGRERYLGLLERSLSVVRAMESSGMSEIATTSQGLREALRPLSAARSRVLAVPMRFGIDVTGKNLREALAAIFAILRPSRIIAPLEAVVAAIRDKVRSILLDGLVTPVKTGIGELEQLVANLDISIFRTELETLHATIRAELAALSPESILDPALDALEAMQAHLEAYDPLDPVRTIIQVLKDAIQELVTDFRPSTLLAPGLELYDEILALARSLDVHGLLDPILEALRDIEAQLGSGLDGAAGAMKHLQDALASADTGGGGGGSLSGSISVTA